MEYCFRSLKKKTLEEILTRPRCQMSFYLIETGLCSIGPIFISLINWKYNKIQHQ
ncbi:hypothetical protein Hanom_Chr14g01246451 [Helianthus anomalus]